MPPRDRGSLTIDLLADRPEAIPVLAEWFFAEWHRFDGRKPGEIRRQLTENLNRHSLPVTFVARLEGRLAGTVSIDMTDLPGFDELSPWLASLIVHPSARGQGIGSMLVRCATDFAGSHRIGQLFLWTAGQTRIYECSGWKTIGASSYGGVPIKLMRLEIEPNRT